MSTAVDKIRSYLSPNEKHKTKLRDIYPFASKDDIDKEPDSWKAHRIGSNFRQLGRKAGHAFQNFDQESNERETSHAKYLNVRNFMKEHPDEKLLDPEHHDYARFRLEVTEDYIKKGQFGKDKQDEDGKEDEKSDAEDSKKENDDDDSQKDAEDKDDSADASKDSEGEGAAEDKEPTPEEKHEAQLAQDVLDEILHFSSVQDNDGRSHAPIIGEQLDSTIDEADQFGPDNWIPRSASLIRLTGKYPMNAQPHEKELFEAGLITPTRLHFVRNHGSVPHLDWKTHTLQVFSDPPGLVKEREYNMDQIAAMKWINIPVTIACDGNRRKEVNLVKRSKAYDWGSGAISCVYWKGVPLRDLLLASGVVEKPSTEQWHVHFEGAKDEDLPEDNYATSIPFDHIMDPMNDVMLAYQMNDQILHPDHGYPIRLIVPGWVGGRMVKWLTKIWVSKKESTNYHHVYDNRVLPSFVTDHDSALAQAFYRHPDTRCNEQGLQSIICKPAQGEIIEVSKVNESYRFAGFAMAGGGCRVQKVEISLDSGKTWLYCFRRYPEEPVRHERNHWTWCHWYRDIAIRDLLNAPEVLVRAFDQYKNPQPEHLTWNLTGMMNNCWYRVKFELSADEKIGLFCRHPVEAVGDGGWMKLSAEQQAAAKAQESESSDKQFTSEEVEKHTHEDDAWIVINNKVYDATSVLSWHPGGNKAILAHAGKVHMETTTEYNSIHDDYANKKTEETCIGSLSDKAIKALKEDAERLEKEKKGGENKRQDYALQEHRWTAIKLIEKKEISHDTRVYKFALPKPSKLGLPIGKHVQVGTHFQDKMVIRPYTPVSPVLASEEDGTISLLIKTYLPDDSKDAKFPPGGTVSNYMDMLKEGQEIDIKGPQGEIEYQGRGKFIIQGQERSYKRITMVAGGTGITPHYQLVHAIVQDKGDDTKINLLYGSESIDDVLMLEDLQKLEKQSNGKFKLWNVLSHPPKNWNQGSGHLDEDDIKRHGFEPSDDSVALLCGPPPMTDSATKILKEWGYKDDENLFGF